MLSSQNDAFYEKAKRSLRTLLLHAPNINYISLWHWQRKCVERETIRSLRMDGLPVRSVKP